MKLYSHWRSSASYRVRIALNLKALTYEQVTIDLDKKHAAQHHLEYGRINPQGVVPSLELDDDTALMQSTAIIEYIEETWPEPPLLPKRAEERAFVRALSQIVCADMHPLHTTRVIEYPWRNAIPASGFDRLLDCTLVDKRSESHRRTHRQRRLLCRADNYHGGCLPRT
jgi:maleylacetoacetate isomerase